VKSLPVFVRKHGPLFVVVLLATWVAYHIGHRDGYSKASEQVAVVTQLLLMENCLAFNANLEQLGKSERMDCSLFSDLNPSAMVL
jgi:hypothetical protein